MPILNNKPINSGVINTQGASVLGTFSGAVLSFSQKILEKYTGAVLGITQDISYLQTKAAGPVVTFEQKIRSKISTSPVLSISQNVTTSANIPFVFKNGWDVQIYINGNLIPRSIIGDNILISRKENGSASLKFTLIPSLGVQNQEQYLGETIFVNAIINIDGTAVTTRMFTGWVDTPTLDLIEQKIHYECSDRRRQQIMQLPYSYISSVGYYSKYVFGDPQDQEDELSKRVQTVPASFDFDQWGNPTLTNWNSSVTIWTYADADVYYENPYPTVQYHSRQSKVNTVLVNLRYTYKRLIQQVATVSWSGYADFYNDWWLQGTPTFPSKTMVQAASTAASWFPIRPITFVNLWPAGGFNGIIWQPNTVTNNYVPKTTGVIIPYYATPTSAPSNTWPDGQIHTMNQTVLDSNGNPVMVLQSQTIVDTSSNLCRGALWFAAKHFTQSITEYYPLEVYSPSGVAAYGRVLKQENITINDSYDATGWNSAKNINTINGIEGTATNLFTNSSGYPTGSTNITCIAGGSGSLNYGNLITFSNDPSGMTYMVLNTTPNVSSGCTIQLHVGLHADMIAEPGLVTVVPDLGSAPGYVNNITKRGDFYNALFCTYNRANTSIRASYRDVTVKIKRFLTPEIDLSHYVHLNCTRINAHGKVSSIEHNINIQTGEAYSMIELLLSRPPAVDAAQSLQISIPPYEDTSYILDNTINVILGTHTGVSPDPSVNPLAVTYNGYVGNANLNPPNQTPNRTKFQEQFVVDYPSLPIDMTDPRTVTAQAPGTASGAETDTAGYLPGVSNFTLAAHGTGFINAGDTFTISGDTSGTIYTATDDITNISSGGTLSFTPALVQAIGTVNTALTFFSNPNTAAVSIPQDSLTVTFL